MKLEVDKLTPELAEYATPRQREYLFSAIKTQSATKTAAEFGVNPRTVQRSLSALVRAAVESGDVSALPTASKLLYLDIETAPMKGYIWRMFDMVTNTDMVKSEVYMLSWAAKWDDSDEIIVKGLCDYPRYKAGTEDDTSLIRDLAGLLDEADFVVAHNGDKFDLKKINTRLILAGGSPVSPYRSIDTMKISKRAFGFSSNKLSWLARHLLGDDKIDTGGFDLWDAVMQGDPEAWKLMLDYNAKDVALLERVYKKIRPWDHLHPNVNLPTSNTGHSCTVCGSKDVRLTGRVVSTGQKGVYAAYRCSDCGHNMRGSVNLSSSVRVQSTLVNIK